MEIDLRELQEGPNEFVWESPPEALHIHDDDLHFAAPIQTRLEIYKLGESLSASGEARLHFTLECVRCLEPFDLHLTAPLRFIFQKSRTGAAEEVNDETLIWIDDTRGIIDLSEDIKDYILLEIPMKPVCSETCAGLCPSCGQNLNHAGCDCKQEADDPRWAALRSLKWQ